jgi:hypothetical protein
MTEAESSLDQPATDQDAARLATLAPPELEEALRVLVRDRGGSALPIVSALAESGSGPVRRLARRALYRLSQQGVEPPPREAKPLVERRPERAVRAWMSAIDGSGSRAVWILVEGGYGGYALCSLIINDVAGVVEAAGGDITKKRLESELAALRAAQRLPWVEFPPEVAVARVTDALALHDELGTAPPAELGRWLRVFARSEATATGTTPSTDPRLTETPVHPAPAPEADQIARLVALPELAGWFLDPERVQADAVALLEARSSRLVVPDQVKTERERSIVTDVVEREMTSAVATRWALRLAETAAILEATDRADAAAVARATARSLVDPDLGRSGNTFARHLAERALEVAIEVVSGRITADAASRRPGAALPVRSPE